MDFSSVANPLEDPWEEVVHLQNNNKQQKVLFTMNTYVYNNMNYLRVQFVRHGLKRSMKYSQMYNVKKQQYWRYIKKDQTSFKLDFVQK